VVAQGRMRRGRTAPGQARPPSPAMPQPTVPSACRTSSSCTSSSKVGLFAAIFGVAIGGRPAVCLPPVRAVPWVTMAAAPSLVLTEAELVANPENVFRFLEKIGEG
jgi:hypothetical protein